MSVAPDEIPMRPLILNGDSDGLKALILDSIKNKPRCWSDIGLDTGTCPDKGG